MSERDRGLYVYASTTASKPGAIAPGQTHLYQTDRAAVGLGKDRFHSVPNFSCARAPTFERWTEKPAVSQRPVFPLHHFLQVRVPQGNKWDAVERVLTKRRHDLDAFALAIALARRVRLRYGAERRESVHG